MSFAGLSKHVMEKLQRSPQADLERNQARQRTQARAERQASDQALLEVAAKKVYKDAYMDAYKAEMARPHPYPSVKKATERMCPVCKRPIGEQAAETVDIGGGLDLLVHKRCMDALVAQQVSHVSLPVGKKPEATPPMQKAFTQEDYERLLIHAAEIGAERDGWVPQGWKRG
jgi:hypothetical protein